MGTSRRLPRRPRSLQKQRFLLPEDVQKYIEEAQASNVLQ